MDGLWDVVYFANANKTTGSGVTATQPPKEQHTSNGRAPQESAGPSVLGFWVDCESLLGQRFRKKQPVRQAVASGSRSFGGINDLRPILQKGDNMRPAYKRSDRQRYLAHHLTGTGGRPRVRFVRKEESK